MNLLGVRLNVLMSKEGPPLPAPIDILEALQSVEVTHSDTEPSGFRINIGIGRATAAELVDDPLVANPLLNVLTRVVLTAFFDITPHVLMDGIVTRRDIVLGGLPGQGQLVLSGFDLSVLLSREHRQIEHPGQDEQTIATKIAGTYAQYGIVPQVIAPPLVDPPSPSERTPQQNCTDWAYLKTMAGRYGYMTYIEAGPVPLLNKLYWGPPNVDPVSQCALSVNLGPETNVTEFRPTQSGISTTLVRGFVKDPNTGKPLPIVTVGSSRPPLGLVSEDLTHARKQRVTWLRNSGLNLAQAAARAQGITDRTSDESITATGTLDSLKYNGALRARSTVGVRGAGAQFDGSYRVRSVTHNISNGKYTQDFSLSRNEIGAKEPLVRVC